MVQKDYLLRQIEKMGVILAGIRERVFGGEAVQAMAELRIAAAQGGVDLGLLEMLTPEALLPFLGEDNLERIIPAAQVLLLKGELEEVIGESEDSAASFEKAALLVRRLESLIGGNADPALKESLHSMRERLDGRGFDGR